MPVCARAMLRSASAADLLRRTVEEERARHAQQSDVEYLWSALVFSETQHFMLRLPVWADLLRELNRTVRCGCAACHWNGLVPEDETACLSTLMGDVKSVKSLECVLQLRMLKLLARLRVSVHVADEPKLVAGVDGGALRNKRTDVYEGDAAVVLRNQVGTPCFFDEEGMCSGWGEPVRSLADPRIAEMDNLVQCAERMRAARPA